MDRITELGYFLYFLYFFISLFSCDCQHAFSRWLWHDLMRAYIPRVRCLKNHGSNSGIQYIYIYICFFNSSIFISLSTCIFSMIMTRLYVRIHCTRQVLSLSYAVYKVYMRYDTPVRIPSSLYIGDISYSPVLRLIARSQRIRVVLNAAATPCADIS